ncbi:MAG: hypothetical protein QXF52_09875 [Thermoproteota archaeon]
MRGLVLPFGYSIGFITSVMVGDKGGILLIKEDKAFTEGLVTGYSMVLGRSFFTVRELYKDAKGRITNVGEPKTIFKILTSFLPRLPDAIFCV